MLVFYCDVVISAAIYAEAVYVQKSANDQLLWENNKLRNNQ